MNPPGTVRRLAGRIVHNWPLKLGAIVLAILLYAALVASQDSSTFPGLVKVTPVNLSPGTVITNQLNDVDLIRYLAPAELGRLRAEDFRATVDLADVTPDGNPVSLRVNVTAFDPRVTILEVRPASIPVVLDQKVSKSIKVVVDLSDPPPGIQVGKVTTTPSEVVVTGASAAVDRVVSARVSATVDASGVSIDRDVRPDLLDSDDKIVSGVNMDPSLVNVQVTVYTNLQNRTVPVNPTVTGTPGAGFRIASIDVEPLTVTVEGDQDQLLALVAADTAPVVVSGATRDVTAAVAYALPNGVTVIGDQTARVTVHISAVTETRTFTAGISLDGRQPAFEYDASEAQILLTLFGSTAALDRLGASPIVISLNVADLPPGEHDVAVVPVLPSSITVAATSPATVAVVVTERPQPTTEPSPTPVPTPADATPTPADGPTATPGP